LNGNHQNQTSNHPSNVIATTMAATISSSVWLLTVSSSWR